VKGALAGGAILLLVIAYVAGFWPQHSQLTEAQSRIATLETRVTDAEARIRLGEVLGKLLRLRESLLSQNFGQAAGLSSSFFDSVRDEGTRTTRPEVKQLLETLQKSRDVVTTSIARADGSALAIVNAQEVTLRQALGYSVSADAK
jgi:type II secretory pathway component PulM